MQALAITRLSYYLTLFALPNLEAVKILDRDSLGHLYQSLGPPSHSCPLKDSVQPRFSAGKKIRLALPSPKLQEGPSCGKVER